MHTFVAHNVLLMHMRFIVLQVYELGYIFQHFKFMAKDKISRVIEQLDEGAAALHKEAEDPTIDRLAVHDDLATCALLKVCTPQLLN